MPSVGLVSHENDVIDDNDAIDDNEGRIAD
jgi:hypothetical protein